MRPWSVSHTAKLGWAEGMVSIAAAAPATTQFSNAGLRQLLPAFPAQSNPLLTLGSPDPSSEVTSWLAQPT